MNLLGMLILTFPDTVCKDNRSTGFDKRNRAALPPPVPRRCQIDMKQ